MKLLLSFCLLASTPTIDTGTISSAHASYDGNALHLKGDVVLNHTLGTMKADEANLQKQVEEQPFPFSVIHLEKQVSMRLNNETELLCDKADLDFSKLQGALTSSDHVIYTDTTTPLKLVGKHVDIQFLKESETDYEIESVLAKEGVALTYANDYNLTTDAILYKNKSHLSSYGNQKTVVTYNDDLIDADRFDLDIVQNQLTLQNPRGTLASLSKAAVQFKADNLLWDHTQNHLILKGSPSIEEADLGRLTTTHEIHLFQNNRQLSRLECYGKSSIDYQNQHHLTSHGTVSFDRETRSGHVDSPKVQNVVPKTLQLSYHEKEMTLFADTAQFNYTEESGMFDPQEILLAGNVRILSLNQDRCGVADKVSYNPTTRTFILAANPGKKVLFVNNQENLRISAQEVHITQDPETKKQVVKGVGNVRLGFTTEEELTLNTHF